VPEVIRPDLITCWPRGHDYPLWRAQVTQYAERFERIIIVFTSDNLRHDTRNFVREALPFAIFTESDNAHWYDHALRSGLALSTAEWVLFTEEDFFCTEEFLDGVFERADAFDMIGSIEAVRVEPSFCLIRRSTLDANDVGFQAGGGLDNFDAFTQAVREFARWTTPTALGLDGWHHMRGLSQNHYLAHYDLPIEYKPEEFANYLRSCLACHVPLDPEWTRDAEGYLLRCAA
jgi:hypothetical protein